jgi:hypothetical protein
MGLLCLSLTAVFTQRHCKLGQKCLRENYVLSFLLVAPFLCFICILLKMQKKYTVSIRFNIPHIKYRVQDVKSARGPSASCDYPPSSAVFVAVCYTGNPTDMQGENPRISRKEKEFASRLSTSYCVNFTLMCFLWSSESIIFLNTVLYLAFRTFCRMQTSW